jgi:hypothetical protein
MFPGSHRYSRHLPILLLLTGVWSVWRATAGWSFVTGDFRSNLWATSYLLVHGASPYAVKSLFPRMNALWLPMAIGTLFPLGWLSEPDATRLWFIYNVVALSGIVLFALEWRKIHPLLLGGILVLAYLFPPTLSHFQLGQFSLTAVLSMFLALRLVRARRDWPAAFFLALAFTKPQLAALFAIGLAVFYARQWGRLGAVLFGIKTLFWAAVMTIPLFAADRAWPLGLLDNFRQNPSYLTPSLFYHLQAAWGVTGLIAWLVLAGLALAVDVALWRRLDPTEAAVWTLALTALVAPYIWTWDFVLLLPLLVFSAVRFGFVQRIVLLLGYAFYWLWIWLITPGAAGGNEQFWWVPAGCLLLVLAIRNYRKIAPAGLNLERRQDGEADPYDRSGI